MHSYKLVQAGFFRSSRTKICGDLTSLSRSLYLDNGMQLVEIARPQNPLGQATQSVCYHSNRYFEFMQENTDHHTNSERENKKRKSSPNQSDISAQNMNSKVVTMRPNSNNYTINIYYNVPRHIQDGNTLNQEEDEIKRKIRVGMRQYMLLQMIQDKDYLEKSLSKFLEGEDVENISETKIRALKNYIRNMKREKSRESRMYESSHCQAQDYVDYIKRQNNLKSKALDLIDDSTIRKGILEKRNEKTMEQERKPDLEKFRISNSPIPFVKNQFTSQSILEEHDDKTKDQERKPDLEKFRISNSPIPFVKNQFTSQSILEEHDDKTKDQERKPDLEKFRISNPPIQFVNNQLTSQSILEEYDEKTKDQERKLDLEKIRISIPPIPYVKNQLTSQSILEEHDEEEAHQEDEIISQEPIRLSAAANSNVLQQLTTYHDENNHNIASDTYEDIDEQPEGYLLEADRLQMLDYKHEEETEEQEEHEKLDEEEISVHLETSENIDTSNNPEEEILSRMVGEQTLKLGEATTEEETTNAEMLLSKEESEENPEKKLKMPKNIDEEIDDTIAKFAKSVEDPPEYSENFEDIPRENLLRLPKMSAEQIAMIYGQPTSLEPFKQKSLSDDEMAAIFLTKTEHDIEDGVYVRYPGGISRIKKRKLNTPKTIEEICQKKVAETKSPGILFASENQVETEDTFNKKIKEQMHSKTEKTNEKINKQVHSETEKTPNEKINIQMHSEIKKTPNEKINKQMHSETEKTPNEKINKQMHSETEKTDNEKINKQMHSETEKIPNEKINKQMHTETEQTPNEKINKQMHSETEKTPNEKINKQMHSETEKTPNEKINKQMHTETEQTPNEKINKQMHSESEKTPNEKINEEMHSVTGDIQERKVTEKLKVEENEKVELIGEIKAQDPKIKGMRSQPYYYNLKLKPGHSYEIYIKYKEPNKERNEELKENANSDSKAQFLQQPAPSEEPRNHSQIHNHHFTDDEKRQRLQSYREVKEILKQFQEGILAEEKQLHIKTPESHTNTELKQFNTPTLGDNNIPFDPNKRIYPKPGYSSQRTDNSRLPKRTERYDPMRINKKSNQRALMKPYVKEKDAILSQPKLKNNLTINSLKPLRSRTGIVKDDSEQMKYLVRLASKSSPKIYSRYANEKSEKNMQKSGTKQGVSKRKSKEKLLEHPKRKTN